MARPRKKKTEVDHILIHEEPKTEWQKALAHLEENYKIYLAGAVFLVACIVIGALLRGMAVIKEREKASSYAEAALVEDPVERLVKYEDVMDSLGKWTPEALYRMGETAIEAESYDKAEEVFNKLVADYPDSDFVPNAVDGLAFLAWNKGDLEGALKGYEQVAQNWPGEFFGRRVHYEIGSVLEEMDRIEDAIAAYKKQVAVFPDSAVARKSQQALDALKEDYPDLFPEEEEDLEATEEVAAEETASEGETESGDVEGEAAVAESDEAAASDAEVDVQESTAEGETAPVVEEKAAAEEQGSEVVEVVETPVQVEETESTAENTADVSAEQGEAVTESSESPAPAETPAAEPSETPTPAETPAAESSETPAPEETPAAEEVVASETAVQEQAASDSGNVETSPEVAEDAAETVEAGNNEAAAAATP